jgi:hypothetical protein
MKTKVNDSTDYKQIAYKLQTDIESTKEKDCSFLKEIREKLTRAFEKRDIAAREMALKMIDDWIDELNKIN